jgi:hypothetical protein
VHRFDGSYVGEWFHQMVVDRASARPRAIPPSPVPAPRPAPSASYRRRSVAEYSAHADAFDRLAGDAAAPPLDQAAE